MREMYAVVDNILSLKYFFVSFTQGERLRKFTSMKKDFLPWIILETTLARRKCNAIRRRPTT